MSSLQSRLPLYLIGLPLSIWIVLIGGWAFKLLVVFFMTMAFIEFLSLRSKNSNFILGTANFGQRYGISKKNKIKLYEIKKMIKFANKNKIKFFDTSRSYKNSEKILGENKSKFIASRSAIIKISNHYLFFNIKFIILFDNQICCFLN